MPSLVRICPDCGKYIGNVDVSGSVPLPQCDCRSMGESKAKTPKKRVYHSMFG